MSECITISICCCIMLLYIILLFCVFPVMLLIIMIIIIYFMKDITTNKHVQYHNKSNTLKLLDKNIVRNNLLTRSKVRPAEYGSSIAPNQSEVKTTILAVQHLGFVSVGSNSQS